MNNVIYHVKDLSCQYNSYSSPVLRIKELKLFEGEVVFFVGASGVGKSTLLETLGLMNNTIDFNSEGEFRFKSNSENTNLRNIWGQPEKALASFRQRNLSFIFQSTNLFPNLSAFENVLLTQIVEGRSYEESKARARAMIFRLFPNERDRQEIIQEGKAITELSGGQRQRLAFVRAAISQHSILLADEPTGNLDWWNAKNLIEILVEKVKSDTGVTVIVTHDIELATNYGDRIVLIKKEYYDSEDASSSYGLLDELGIFTNEGDSWKNSQNESITGDELSSYLKNQLK
ncbi:ATP-binding cassette domain-containing protein [Schleiferiaceae bacterium]|nr:ATP-binding cassette domain-containing protein [Schleiferiaceae bacterium]